MKRIIFLSVVIFLLFIIVNLSVSLITLWSKKDLLTQAKKELERQQQEHTMLQKEFVRVNNPYFVEEEARNKLFLGKPGEAIVIVPTASPSASQKESTSQKPIWQQWWELFF